MKKTINIICTVIFKHPLLSFFILLALLGTSFYQTGKLTINSNQIDLLPADSREVVKTKEVVEMIGGNGFFIVALKLKDEKGMTEHFVKAQEAKRNGQMDVFESEMKISNEILNANLEYYKDSEKKIKRFANKINRELLKDKDVRYISYRYDTSFLKDRLPLFVSPDDVREVRNRIKRKIDEEIEKRNPFYINLGGEEYTPDFTDILDKYRKLSKRDIFDDYNISRDKTMLMLLVKPEGNFLDLVFTRNLEKKIEKVVADLKVEENGIHVAFSGSYKLNLDDYDSVINALKPISIASLIGIVLLLFIFFRNPLFIVILVISLLSGVVFSFGITGYVIGKLNTITSVMAAVLMGLGIDYGIQFLYRFREEYTLRDEFLPSVVETIYHTGEASFISALTTTSAFLVLMFSEFKGFSEFGLIALYGIVVIALCMYLVTALQIGLLLKYFPSTSRFFYLQKEEREESGFVYRLFSNPKRVLIISSVIIIIIGSFAPFVKFNYSGRDLLLENQESLLIYDEIATRFDISSDPQAIVVDSLEKSEALYDFFTPVPDNMKQTVDQVISMWSLDPPINQQRENLELLKLIKEDIKPIKPEMLDEKYRAHFPRVEKYLSVEPFSYKDLPEHFVKPFREVPTSKIKGHLLFVYPKVALWHGHDLLNFYNAVGEFEYPLISKRTLNTLLYSSKDLNLFGRAVEHSLIKYTPEEESFIVEAANTYSASEMEELGILPLTAKLIVEKRPFKSVSDIRAVKDKAYTAGSVILFAKLARIVQGEAFPAVFLTLGIVLGILIIFYRGFLPAVLSLFPLIVGLVVMLGLMVIANKKINFFNVMVFPIVIGYAIQNGIYIYFRFMEEKNITRTISKVGPAIIASTLTTLVGWSVLLLAEHRGLHSLGVVASIGIGSSLVVALTLLPSMLALVYSPKKVEEEVTLGLNFDTAVAAEEAIPVTDSNLASTDSSEEKEVQDKFSFSLEIEPEIKQESGASNSDIPEVKSKKKKTAKKKSAAKKKSSTSPKIEKLAGETGSDKEAKG